MSDSLRTLIADLSSPLHHLVSVNFEQIRYSTITNLWSSTTSAITYYPVCFQNNPHMHISTHPFMYFLSLSDPESGKAAKPLWLKQSSLPPRSLIIIVGLSGVGRWMVEGCCVVQYIGH